MGKPTPEQSAARAAKGTDSKLAAMSRMAIRKYRNTEDPDSLRLHELTKATCLERGLPRFGVTGWDDALTSPDR